MYVLPTPHIGAKVKSEISKTVLMPGDPLRAKFIAAEFLDNVVQYNNIRGMFGFTGFYKGKRISIQSSGMGIPSMGIYSYELFNYYDVDNIIRIGTAGSISSELKIKDIVFAMSASTDSNFQNQFSAPGIVAPTANFDLLIKAYNIAKNNSQRCFVGNVLTTDVFYNENKDFNDIWDRMGVLAVEMECAALYLNASRCKKNALGILTISDTKNESTSAEEREKSFIDMIEISLELAYKTS